MTSSLAPLLELGLARPLADCAPWQVAVIGPPDDDTRLHQQIGPWLRAIPHESGMPLELVIASGALNERLFPWPMAFVWPVRHPWQPLLNPWQDPGFGSLWVELVGDPQALRDQVEVLTDKLYRALVLDPPSVAPLVLDTLEQIGATSDWSAATIRALAQDARPLQRDAEVVQLWLASDSEADTPLMALSLLAGSGPLHRALLPTLSARWAEAVIDPRDLTPEMVAALPRTVPSDNAAAVQRACGQLGAIRRQVLLERLAEVLHEAAWELQVAEQPLAHQAWCGVHRFGDHPVHRWGWQRPIAGEQSFLYRGLSHPTLAVSWDATAIAAAGPLFGLPVHGPRTVDLRDALRVHMDWTQVTAMRGRGIVLRAGSKGVLRTQSAPAYVATDGWRAWLLGSGLVSECHQLDPVAAILG